MLQPEFERGLARAQQFTRGRQNPLVQAAERFLDPQQRAFFDLAYASMRLADDLVDEGFLALPPRERREARVAAFRELSDWQLQAEWAAGESSLAGELEPELFAALGHFLRRSNLGAQPWQRLARALRRDLQELPISTWAEYLEYCEGACVAPATVFVYLVGAEFQSDGTSRFPAEHSARELARPLAIFAYLVHLLRDLREDASKCSQLVHLPRVWFAAAELDFDRSVAELAGGGELPEPIVNRLHGQLFSSCEKAAVGLERVRESLRPEAHAALMQIVQQYERAWEAVQTSGLKGMGAKG